MKNSTAFKMCIRDRHDLQGVASRAFLHVAAVHPSRCEGERYFLLSLIHIYITGKNFTGQEYRAYIVNWILHQGFELGPVELWCDGRFVERGEIRLAGKEVCHG